MSVLCFEGSFHLPTRLSTFAMAQGAPFESVFQEVLGEGDQVGQDCDGGLRA